MKKWDWKKVEKVILYGSILIDLVVLISPIKIPNGLTRKLLKISGKAPKWK
jgi:hypothetical protein